MKLLLSVLALAAGSVAAETVAPIVSYAAQEQVVDGQFVVVFNEGAMAEFKQAVTAIRRHRVSGLSHADISEVNVNDKFLAISGTFTTEQIEALRRFNGVQYLEQAAVFRADTEEDFRRGPLQVQECADVDGECTWNLDRIDQASLPLNEKYFYRETGEDVDVYVIDSGVNTRAPTFEGRAKHGVCFDPVTGRENPSIRGCGTDCMGHGTHVAGTIADKVYGVAKKSNIIGVKMLSCNGFGATAGTLNSIAWVTEQHQKSGKKFSVANMSIGGPFSVATNNAIAAGTDVGVVFVTSAGNSGSDACHGSPASAAAAITVGATDKHDNFASFSNHGRCVDVLAPGVNVRSLRNTPWEKDAVPRGSLVASGTSMAAPNVAGAVALTIASEGEKLKDAHAVIEYQLETKVVHGKIQPRGDTRDALLHAI
ncbi:MAG: hypothetical protein MHM6MM_001087 [Cercozoa sp. M6MM]